VNAWPTFETALDALGRPALVLFDFAGDIKPGATRTVRANVALNAQLTLPAAFPIVTRTHDDFWEHAVPGAFTEDQVEYDFRPTGKCDGGYATAQVTVRRIGDHHDEPSGAYFSNGQGGHLTMPFTSYREPYSEGEARVYLDDPKKCPTITAISGRVPGWHYVVLP
jgi:hypothetical protein